MGGWAFVCDGGREGGCGDTYLHGRRGREGKDGENGTERAVERERKSVRFFDFSTTSHCKGVKAK